jgi:hypothetical protein
MLASRAALRKLRALAPRPTAAAPRPRRAMAAAAAASAPPPPAPLLSGEVFFLDSFALRQWEDSAYSGTRLACDRAALLARIHALHAAGAAPLVGGYAPFCKHLFVPNEVGATVGALEITEANAHLLRSGYLRRRPEELAVLARWFPAAAVTPPPAAWLDVILYSREQLEKERAAMPDAKGALPPLPAAPWGIISIKAQAEGYETPMSPITAMRNSLGREEGGSGVPIDRAAYEAAVAYWEQHAVIA